MIFWGKTLLSIDGVRAIPEGIDTTIKSIPVTYKITTFVVSPHRHLC